VTRVTGELAGQRDQLAGLRRIGVDEMAHRKGHRYITQPAPGTTAHGWACRAPRPHAGDVRGYACCR
jgi:hypothetical protein